MKLLNACSWEIREFMSEHDTPPYAIVSHTWGQDEVTFSDWQHVQWADVMSKEGFLKIRYSAAQAVQDGLEWVWIDTCCINKDSSAELSEAINSMFKWYKNAVVCYVYLADVDRRRGNKDSKLARSRWFTRGWTLQELLAPGTVTFYTKEWARIGSKASMVDTISAITRIDKEFLCGADLRLASISKKFSWAARRETSRTEDVAYCLLGLFDVNIPLLYGEGARAFQRLQQELISAYPYDHTLYAWGTPIEVGSLSELPGNPVLDHSKSLQETVPWNKEKAEKLLLGLFAQHPKDFEASGRYVPLDLTESLYPVISVRSSSERDHGARVYSSGAISIKFPLLPTRISISHRADSKIVQMRGAGYAVLSCGETSDTPDVLIPLHKWGYDYHGRTPEYYKITSGLLKFFWLHKKMNRAIIAPSRPIPLQHGDVVTVTRPSADQSKFMVANGNSTTTWVDMISGEDIHRVPPEDRFTSILAIQVRLPGLHNGAVCGVSFDLYRDDRRVGNCTLDGNRVVGLGPLVIHAFAVSGVTGGDPRSAPRSMGLVWPHFERHPLQRLGSFSPLATHVLGGSSAVVQLDVTHLPRLLFRTERVPLTAIGCYVDLLEYFFINDHPGTFSYQECTTCGDSGEGFSVSILDVDGNIQAGYKDGKYFPRRSQRLSVAN